MITELDALLTKCGYREGEDYVLSIIVVCHPPRLRPHPEAPRKLRPQVASAAPMTSWQRCPERHRHRESRQRWQREAL